MPAASPPPRSDRCWGADMDAAGQGWIVFGEIAAFVALLALALAYVWRKGGLEWDR